MVVPKPLFCRSVRGLGYPVLGFSEELPFAKSNCVVKMVIVVQSVLGCISCKRIADDESQRARMLETHFPFL